ncbi:16S rRNA (guanine(966)-N(2))-methyltransferase RsmD [Anoxynatronum sibiricum]|uniref:16S rRNA (Guanine(966)-N(2))-methyltransferase RsmD n=1 Tax=Anoxynatronum sibiricum TaxID=210623 RepID=A0ABU9VQT9_9CLOT
MVSHSITICFHWNNSQKECDYMRVIGGIAKGHRLLSPKGTTVRPTSDRVREAIFNSIQSRVGNAVVLDLFAGAGTLGIEALSRNAKKAFFVDSAPRQIELIKENLIKTRLLEWAELIQQDSDIAIKRLKSRQIMFDLVFADPPYCQGYIEKTLLCLNQAEVVKRDGLVVVEFSFEEKIPEKLGDFHQTSVRKYGTTGVAYYSRKEERE